MNPISNAQPEMSATSQQAQPLSGAGPSQPPPRARGESTLRERMSSQEATMSEVVRQLQELRELLISSRQQTMAGPSQPTPPQSVAVPPPPTSQMPQIPNEHVVGQNMSQTAVLGRQGQGEDVPRGDAVPEQPVTGQPAQAITGSQGGMAGGQTRAVEGTGESQSAAARQTTTKGKRPRKISKKELERMNVDSFHRMHLPTFSWGTSTEAEDWLDEMNKAFNFLNCSDSQRVQFAIYKLSGEAHRWWATQERAYESMQVEVTWDKFRQAFFDKFFPSTLQIEKAIEFATLQQGSMSVAEYETKFSTLIRFAPEANANDEMRRRRFEEGLDERIRFRVQSYECDSYGEAVRRALFAEKEFKAVEK